VLFLESFRCKIDLSYSRKMTIEWSTGYLTRDQNAKSDERICMHTSLISSTVVGFRGRSIQSHSQFRQILFTDQADLFCVLKLLHSSH